MYVRTILDPPLQENEQRQKLDEIISQVMEQIIPRCSCVFEIGSETFSCRGVQENFENTVVFRARITVQGLLVAADDVVNDIDGWVDTSPSITVGLATLDIDSSCPAMLASTDSADCETVTESPFPSLPPPSSPSSSSDSSPSIGIIVGAVGAVVVVVLIIVIIVVAVLVCVRRKGSYR